MAKKGDLETLKLETPHYKNTNPLKNSRYFYVNYNNEIIFIYNTAYDTFF